MVPTLLPLPNDYISKIHYWYWVTQSVCESILTRIPEWLHHGVHLAIQWPAGQSGKVGIKSGSWLDQSSDLQVHLEVLKTNVHVHWCTGDNHASWYEERGYNFDAPQSMEEVLYNRDICFGNGVGAPGNCRYYSFLKYLKPCIHFVFSAVYLLIHVSMYLSIHIAMLLPIYTQTIWTGC